MRVRDKGQLTELPLATELKDFTIDEYPPKLMLIDNETGRDSLKISCTFIA